jgi:threonine aldolase
MSGTVDLRSDTVTRPTPAMRRAMAECAVGDDVLGDDPTVKQLEELAAGMLGKEAALLVPSGCMANLIAVIVHTGRQSAALVGDSSHIWVSEAGSHALVGGLPARPLPTDRRGRLSPADVERWAVDDLHLGRAGLLCLENTHNFCGGTVLGPDELGEITAPARERRLALHLDGARIFNAAVALGVDARRLADPFDSVMFCLSKGLCSPVGSVLCGTGGFVAEARRVRKLLGGGMRQAGVLAACGLVSLGEMTGRLAEDHGNARFLAENLVDLPGVDLDVESVQTNMVVLGYGGGGGRDLGWLKAELARRGVLALARPAVGALDAGLRLVLHNDVSRDDCERALAVFREVTSEGRAGA